MNVKFEKIQLIFLSNRYCLFTFLIAGVIYLFTLAPTVTGEDSGELISAAYGWGISHPPGYPLWTLLAGCFIRLARFGCIAYRVNLLSAILAAFSAAVLCKILQRFLSIQPLLSLLGGVLFACGLHLWSQAVIAEVYTLQILITCLILYAFLGWKETENSKYLYLVSLLVGLGLANHHLIFLLVPILLIAVTVNKPKIFLSPKITLLCLLFLVIGLLPYLYLPIASRHEPYMNWGSPDTFQNFLDHILRKQYGDESMKDSRTIQGILFHWKTLWQWNSAQYTLFSTPFMVAGLLALFLKKKYRSFFYFSIFYFVIHTFFLAELLNFKEERQELFCSRVFFLPTYIITVLWITLGCQEGIHLLLKKFLQSKFIKLISFIFLAVVVLVAFNANYKQNNMRHYYYAADHAENILNSLELDAIIIPSGDHNTFPLIYKHYVEGVRPDITIADKYGYIEYDLYKDMPNAPQKIRTRKEREDIEIHLITKSGRPVYFTIQPSLIRYPEFKVFPHGMLFRLYLVDEKTPTLPLPLYTYKNIHQYKTITDHAASVILSDYYFYLASNALRQGHIQEADTYIETTEQLSKGLKEEMNNLGTLLAEYGQTESSIRFFENAARLDKEYLTPRWNLARLFKAQGDQLHAIQVFNDIAIITPEDFRVFGELGFLLYQHGEVELAIKNWGKSLWLNPDQPQIIEAFNQITTSIPSSSK